MTPEDMIEEPATRVEDAPDSPVKRQVEAWCKRIEQAKAFHEPAFKQMREDMRFARGLQWPGQTQLDDWKYVANIVQRHLKQREAALYAKNPKAVAHRRKTLDYAVWDGDPNTLMQAQQTMMQAQQMQMQAMQTGVMPPPEIMQQMQQAQALIQDYEQGQTRRQQLDAMAATLEIVWEHQLGEQQPPFKASMKHLVRRALTTGVAYQKLGYHRFEDYRPEDVSRVTDLTEQIAALETLMAKQQDEDADQDDTRAELADLQDLLAKVTQEQEAFIREGLDFDYPRSTSIIPDPECHALQGFVGAHWVAQEFMLTPDQVRNVYGKRIDKDFTPYSAEGKEMGREAFDPDHTGAQKDGKDTRAVVWEIWDKHHGQTFTVCQGHSDYLVAPKTPDVHIEQFWPFFVLTFNGLEDESLFPPSDVRLIRHQQQEMNLMRQRLREHRDASRPGHVSPHGRMDQKDKDSLANRNAHDVIEIHGLAEQDDVRRILQPIPVNPIDPNQYEVASLQDDVYKVVGTQEAVMGGSSGATATETSIAESSRLSAIGSNVDDLDDHLTYVAKAASHLLLVEMTRERVTEIAGRGAVWPQVTAGEVAQDLWLEVRAGSSGRPNKSAEIQNLERLLPFFMQVPGVKPQWLLEQLVERLDDRIDPSDAFDPMLPAMAAMNRQAEVSRGGEDEDPNAQGGEGGDKTAVAEGDSNMGPREPKENRNMDPNRA